MFRIVPTLLIGLCLLIASPLSAQDFQKPFESAYTSAASATVQFDVDLPDTFSLDPTIVTEVIYRDPALNLWNGVAMNELYSACSLLTYSATVPYSTSSESLEWYNRSENEAAVATGSPKNSANSFPVPDYLLADLGSDSTGDVSSGSGTHLDITHCYASYSDTRLYVRMDNAGGGFPTNSGFTFFAYNVGLVDPDTQDSVAFSFVYANVPFLLSPGLYKFDPSDSSFTKVADISTNISGNSLSMACDISDLVAQPEWSGWPPPSGFITTAPLTATQDVSNFVSNDWGKVGVFIPESNTSGFSSNTGPSLTDPLIYDAGEGIASAEVVYTDTDNHLPVTRLIHFGPLPVPMTACEKDYAAGTLFTADIAVETSGWYDYYFEFSDGLETATTELDSVYISVSAFVPGDANGSGAVDIDDVVFLIGYIFSGGPAPDPLESGDADCSGGVDIDDVVYLIGYIFSGGPPPQEC